MNKRLISVMLLVAVIGWGSTASNAADLAAVTMNPAQFLNHRVEITAPVVENSPLERGEFKRWTFIVGGADYTLAVYESGFNPATIIEAHGLVEEARETGNQITVTGKLEKRRSGLLLKLKTVRFEDKEIVTDAGPFVDDLNSEGLPWTPLWYDGIKYYPGEFPL